MFQQIGATAITPPNTPPVPAPVAPVATPGNNGSIVDYLASLGQDSSIGTRSTLAGSYGIQNYTGTADQNTTLLAALRAKAAGATVPQASAVGTAVGTGNTNPLGVPNNMNTTFGGSSTTPSSSTPINLSDLSQSNPDIAGLLATGVLGDLSSSQLSGLSAVLGNSSSAQGNYDSIGKALTDAMGSEGAESGDLQTALNSAGVPQAQQQLSDLNVSAANLKGQLDAFDNETDTGNNNISQQSIPAGLIQGQQAAYANQRTLQRGALASQLSAETALITAYQGNIDSATKLAQQAVTMKYAPIDNQIKVLQQQLSMAKDNLTSAQTKQASVVSDLLDVKKTQLANEQATQKQIQTLAVTAASNGAPLSVVRSIQNSTDPAAAASLGKDYVGSTSPLFNDGGTGATFTSTQLNKGASNADMTISDFKGLDADSQNFFLNQLPTSQLEKDIKAIGTSSGKSAQDIADNIAASTQIPDAAKTALYKSIGAQPTQAGSSGGGFFSGVFNGIKNLLDF